jgi:hypothetical protein
MSGDGYRPVLYRLRSALGLPLPERSEHDHPKDGRSSRLRGIEACDVCGRTILPGEVTARFTSAERTITVCPICEARALSQGYQRAA